MKWPWRFCREGGAKQHPTFRSSTCCNRWGKKKRENARCPCRPGQTADPPYLRRLGFSSRCCNTIPDLPLLFWISLLWIRCKAFVFERLTFFQGEKEYTPPPRDPSFSVCRPTPRSQSKNSYGVNPFPGKTREKGVHHRSGEKGIHHRASDPEKGKKRGSPRWWCIYLFLFPVFPKFFRDSAERKIHVFGGGFPCFPPPPKKTQKKQGKEDEVLRTKILPT